jgi:6-phosphogluconolactonase
MAVGNGLAITGFASAAEMAQATAKEIATALSQALATRRRAVFIATGGGTAPDIYAHLREADLDWANIDVTLSDERRVPGDHPASNARLLRESLFLGPAAKARFHPLDSDTAITALSFPADITLLGMGADLHVASIFAAGVGMTDARLSSRRVVSTEPDPLPNAAPFARRTLTLSALCETRKILIAFTGLQKREALEKAHKTGQDVPVLALLARAGPKLSWRWAS